MDQRDQAGTGWAHLLSVAAVSGIGFTVALFMANLAFTETILGDLAMVGIFIGSVVAVVTGALALYRARPAGGRS